MEKLVRIQSFVAQYGVWSALLCWLPFIGEPIALALGYFKADSLKFHLLMSLGKTARYIVIIYFLS